MAGWLFTCEYQRIFNAGHCGNAIKLAWPTSNTHLHILVYQHYSSDEADSCCKMGQSGRTSP